MGTDLLKVSREETLSGRINYMKGRSYGSAHNSPPSQLVHQGEGVTGTCHSNEGITMALHLQLAEHAASIHTLGTRHTQPFLIQPVRCRGRAGRWEEEKEMRGEDGKLTELGKEQTIWKNFLA